MDNGTSGMILALLVGLLWVTGSILQWRNIRREEKLIARLLRKLVRGEPKPAGTAETTTPPENAGPQEKLERRSMRPVPKPAGTAEPLPPPESAEPLAEDLRPARHWTVG
jgi:hypothetical protein